MGGNARGLAPWETTNVGRSDGSKLEIVATPARHGPHGIEPISGEVTGFVISRSGEALVYVTGDTVWFDGVAEVARRFQPKVLLLFAGSAQARGPFSLTMNTNDAVETARYFPDAAIVPLHHQGWKHFTQSQEDLVKTFAAMGIGNRLRPIEPGQSVTVEL